MYEVVGVRFKKAGKIYYFDPGELQIQKGDHVIVETVRGIEYGKVVTNPKQVDEHDIVLPLKKVIRLADEKDLLNVEENKKEAKKAYTICMEKIEEHGLEMKLVEVEYTFDRNKIIFYFTADGRIDFRELVKDLAAIFRTRIELRQIGVRDEAKMLGGIGPCGRILCCSTFLGDFDPVSIKMAKDQNLSLNPAKISGLCGRLMCCLKFENDDYETAKAELPDLGESIMTPQGSGKVVGINILDGVVQVELFELERVVEYTIGELLEQGTMSF
ncbi:PSP1 domain-containing protein [Calidifontibacillus erzurumensis]|uniref:Stage 0 sporulation family protein n=1 Tax=Calidifontibacillus erzurumensis TaxID=2741433 RepID=A0A8J8KDB9_9BACI|nr:stage 0 sporulation family protein [Calidifontibacillus erzurumensis]NSL52868.1 stage 0 sporulation family protein [Calidifontibacillus erzurumensis]